MKGSSEEVEVLGAYEPPCSGAPFEGELKKVDQAEPWTFFQWSWQLNIMTMQRPGIQLWQM